MKYQKTWAPREWMEAAWEYAFDQAGEAEVVGLAAIQWKDGTRGFEISYQETKCGNMLSVARVTLDEVEPYRNAAMKQMMVPIAEASTATGVAESTIRKYAGRGQVRAEKRHKAWYVWTKDIEHLVKSGEIITRQRGGKMSKDSYLLKDRTEACKRDYIDNLARVGASRCEELGQIERLTEYLRRLENEPIERVLGIEPELELWMAQPLQLAAQAKEVKDLQQYFTERLQEIREKYG